MLTLADASEHFDIQKLEESEICPPTSSKSSPGQSLHGRQKPIGPTEHFSASQFKKPVEGSITIINWTPNSSSPQHHILDAYLFHQKLLPYTPHSAVTKLINWTTTDMTGACSQAPAVGTTETSSVLENMSSDGSDLTTLGYSLLSFQSQQSGSVANDHHLQQSGCWWGRSQWPPQPDGYWQLDGNKKESVSSKATRHVSSHSSAWIWIDVLKTSPSA
jgi:hypothetical protein